MTNDTDGPTRPSRSRLVTIDDCSWVKLFDNPAPKCTHDLHWRESDYDDMPAEVQAKMCNERACAAVEFHPHRGESVTLRVYRTVGDRQLLSQLGSALAGDIGAVVSLGVKDASIQALMGDVLARHVEAWTWTAYDEPLPLPSEDWPRVWESLEMSELMSLVNAVQVGGQPIDALRAMGNG